MADATAPINTPERSGDTINLGVAAVAVYAGVLGAVNAAGFLVQAADAANLIVIGKVQEDALNADGAAGDLTANVKRGVFRFANSATNALTIANIGAACFVEDSVTVSSDGGTNSIKAGIVVAVDSEGVWIDTRMAPVA